VSSLVPNGTSAEMSGQFGTGAEVSYGHFGTSAKMSCVRSVLGPKCVDTDQGSVETLHYYYYYYAVGDAR